MRKVKKIMSLGAFFFFHLGDFFEVLHSEFLRQRLRSQSERNKKNSKVHRKKNQKQPLKNVLILLENTCVGVIRKTKRFQHRHFCLKFMKVLKTTFLKNICKRLLLKVEQFLIHLPLINVSGEKTLQYFG